MPVQLRWADFDANFHLRHSAYYDFGATARIDLFTRTGLTGDFFKQNGFGPILLRESAEFRREVTMQDTLTITTALAGIRPNGSRFAIRHQIFKANEVLAATIDILGDWIDYQTRRLYQPTEPLTAFMLSLPRTTDFQFT